MSISGAIESIGPASLDRLGFEYLVTLGEGDPGLLAARPKMPRRPQPRRIVEAAGAHANGWARLSRCGRDRSGGGFPNAGYEPHPFP